MDGFPGSDGTADFMRTLERWQFCRIAKDQPPAADYHVTKLISAGHDFKKQGNDTADMQPGLHFKVQPGGMYVMLQEIEALGSLPHRFIWVYCRIHTTLLLRFTAPLYCSALLFHLIAFDSHGRVTSYYGASNPVLP